MRFLEELIKSLLNNINRDYNYVKISVYMDKDWEQLKLVVLGWWDYVNFFSFYDIVIILLYNK